MPVEAAPAIKVQETICHLRQAQDLIYHKTFQKLVSIVSLNKMAKIISSPG
jgi:hypothetical protein